MQLAQNTELKKMLSNRHHCELECCPDTWTKAQACQYCPDEVRKSERAAQIEERQELEESSSTMPFGPPKMNPNCTSWDDGPFTSPPEEEFNVDNEPSKM